MAVNSQSLQKHAVLVSLVVAGITFILVALAGTVVSKAMLARVINVQPGQNGLGHISSELPNDEKTLGNTATRAGQDINRALIFESTADNSVYETGAR